MPLRVCVCARVCFCVADLMPSVPMLCMFTCVYVCICVYTVGDMTAGCTHDWEQMGAVGVCVHVCVCVSRREAEEGGGVL